MCATSKQHKMGHLEVDEWLNKKECSWQCFRPLKLKELARPAGASEGVLGLGMAFQMGVGPAAKD